MASVTSLDQDMRNLRMSRYTSAAANEARAWIEQTLGRSLPAGDLLDSLKDGVALCELANKALGPPGVKINKGRLPFMMMENISHFLKACETPPLSLPAHDRFLTVDLYESKDPAQVLQCLGAFSRRAHAAQPNTFKTTIGPRKSGQIASPQGTGEAAANGASRFQNHSSKPSNASLPSSKAMSPSVTGGSQSSQASGSDAVRSPGPISSWSKKSDESNTAPAWNIHQYGYMGGANQGSQGVSFGARRQITSPAPQVPSLAEKERIRKQKAEEEQRARQQAEREERERQIRLQQEEEEAQAEEQRRWEEETTRLRSEERQRLEDQKRQWEEDERRWKDEEEVRRKEEEKIVKSRPPEKPRVPSSGVLRGQTLSQYRREQASEPNPSVTGEEAETPEQRRVRELEQMLEEARERERQYKAEREERSRRGVGDRSPSRPSTSQSNVPAERPPSVSQSEASWAGDEREYQRRAWQSSKDPAPPKVGTARGLPGPPDVSAPRGLPVRPLPQPVETSEPPAQAPAESAPPPPSRSVQNDDEYEPQRHGPNRTDDYLSKHAAPTQVQPRISASAEAGDTSLEQHRDRDRRIALQQKTKAGGWASKSLLEREMEKERERQKEWEENQNTLKSAPRDATQGAGAGQSWDINQYGYTGGDSANRGSSAGSGINFGGRRQIIGPRPQK